MGIFNTGDIQPTKQQIENKKIIYADTYQKTIKQKQDKLYKISKNYGFKTKNIYFKNIEIF